MHRTSPRLTRILACAALPLALVLAGCSSDSGDGDKKAKDDKEKGASSSASPGGDSAGSGSGSGVEQPQNVEAARFAKLPDACGSVSKRTVGNLLPAAKPKGGTPGKSSDLLARANCSWNSLDDDGVKGSQYRWMDVSYLRFESEQALNLSGEQRAKESLGKELAKAQSTKGATDLRTSVASGVGDEAQAVVYKLRKTDADFSYATVVARTGNVVITLTYNGTGYAGAKNPTVEDITKGAVEAAKTAVASVAAVNKDAGTAPSKGASPNPSTNATKAAKSSTSSKSTGTKAS
ncbi:DUF3558 domain-containing protein [Streptomyces sp. NPDC048057]|uniref:DUF3558 domain-containing protein n=1 Tax=Streptomyces sp. NPDC048057 TaxID=3155628 RepID=UPI0033F5B448